MKVQVVYSIGTRCYTEIILKRLGYVKFSSIFGSMNLRNYKNVTSCFTTDLLFYWMRPIYYIQKIFLLWHITIINMDFEHYTNCLIM